VGKTRLARAVAARAREADGVWFVDLSPLGEEHLVLSSFATALGIRERPGRLLAEVLCAMPRRMPLDRIGRSGWTGSRWSSTISAMRGDGSSASAMPIVR
jgi:hypothetical protein